MQRKRYNNFYIKAERDFQNSLYKLNDKNVKSCEFENKMKSSDKLSSSNEADEPNKMQEPNIIEESNIIEEP
ncbi:hypothetical protein PFTANZ_00424 [Plasmodium falciparum Tanzania (2000708)]|nr:hypothetical protein PFTANZ_00424 [Plasmodium falciparum Tanzania (2000708)]